MNSVFMHAPKQYSHSSHTFIESDHSLQLILYLHNNHQIFERESPYQSTASGQQGHVSWGPLDTMNRPFHTCQLGSQ